MAQVIAKPLVSGVFQKPLGKLSVIKIKWLFSYEFLLHEEW